MNLRSYLPFAALSLFAGIACSSSSSDGGAPAAQAGTVNAATAKQAAATTIQASITAVKSNDGQASAMQFQSAAAQAQGIVTPAAPSGTGSANLGSSLAGGTCTCDATAMSCTFTDCGDTSGTTINGTESWTGGHVLCDLTFKTTQSIPLTMTTKCDLTVSDTQIDGTLDSTGSADLSGTGAPAGTGAYSWSCTTKFDKVGISNGQAASGSVTVHGSYSIAGQTYAGDATVTYP